ncbi:hypothetical protein BCR32DRAFT_296407 [Anaeromyces robustus]|uniref:Protein PNS1 n=1 Tax=Anaeromyces robustus TaxID=1754192 RepID=A0A1Y1WRL9_9FUNG|nr:hypothetical protein BCR32DRAFT_296407 [Anaeromyces robustus]|eukprot:ORX76191.1 hypothetical protein BCR32DRAFT_296407 [Anaeromyces robustus]
MEINKVIHFTLSILLPPISVFYSKGLGDQLIIKNINKNINNNDDENEAESENINENVKINININEDKSKKNENKLKIFTRVKKYKRVRKTVKKEKVEVFENPKISNIWAIVLFISVVIGCFQLSISGIISIIKNGKDEDLYNNISEIMNDDKGKVINSSIFDYDTYTLENPTETYKVSIVTSTPIETVINTFRNSKINTEITPTYTSTITPTSIYNDYDYDQLAITHNETTKKFDVRYFDNNEKFDDAMEDYFNRDIYNINFEKRQNSNNNNNNITTEDDDEKKKEEIKDTILEISVKVITYIVSFCLTVIYYKLLILHTDKVFDYTFRIVFIAAFMSSIAFIVFGYFWSIWIWTFGYLFTIVIIVIGIYLKRKWMKNMKFIKRIKFSEAFLNESIAPIRSYPSIFFLSMVNCIFKAILDYFIIYTMYKAFINDAAFLEFSNITFNRTIFIMFLLFSYFYSTKVIESIIYVTATTLYTYYMYRGKPAGDGLLKIEGIPNPTKKCFLRTIKGLLGSICTNALIMTIFDSMNNLLSVWKKILSVISLNGELAKSRNPIFKAIGDFYKVNKQFIDFVEYISELFEEKTLNELAIFSKPLIQASEDAFYLMKEHDDDLLFDNMMIKLVLVLSEISIVVISVIISVAICACFGKFNTKRFVKEVIDYYGRPNNVTQEEPPSFDEVNEYISIALTGTKAIFTSVFVITDAAVLTLFMCICRDAHTIKEIKPDIYIKLVKNKPEDNSKMSKLYEAFLDRLEDFN